MNFVMNLYLYTLTAKTLKRTATRLRLVLGSGVGAVLYVCMLFVPAPVFIKRFALPMLVSIGLTAVIFRLKNIKLIFRVTGYMFVYAFALGGMLKFSGSVILSQRMQKSVWYIAGAGMMGYQLIDWWLGQVKRKNRKWYKVCLIGYGERVWTEALLDTGNSLREPVSGRPVSVVDEELLAQLASVQLPQKKKVIPYHSVGKRNGMMEGYEIPEIIIYGEEEEYRRQRVIVAISTNRVSAEGRYRMILHPDMCGEASGSEDYI